MTVFQEINLAVNVVDGVHNIAWWLSFPVRELDIRGGFIEKLIAAIEVHPWSNLLQTLLEAFHFWGADVRERGHRMSVE